jgi:hypothetical protein
MKAQLSKVHRGRNTLLNKMPNEINKAGIKEIG